MSRIPSRRLRAIAAAHTDTAGNRGTVATLTAVAVGALIFTLLAGSALAQSGTRSPFDGGHVSIAAGYIGTGNAVSLGNAGLAGLADVTTDADAVQLNTGFGRAFGQFYVGLESTGLYRVGGFGDTVVAGSFVDSTSSATYGISARAGWLVESNLLLFGRIGWERLDYLRGATPNLISLGSDDFIDGLRLGLGADLIATKYLSTRLEFAYIDYDDVTQGIGGTAIQVEPEEATFRLGVAYRF